jgi:hypothetical protein
MSQTNQTTTVPDAYRTTWNDTNDLYAAIVETVGTATDLASSTIVEQYDRAHARALRDLFDGDGGSVTATGVVKFVVGTCTVSVHSDGRLVVEPPDETHDGTST